MNVLDLFSGIGGFSLGLERAGMRTVAFCERDEFCRAVLAKHWPDSPCFDDVHAVDADRLGGLGRIDLVCGGFPCQPFSVAGKQRAQKDDRHLWPQMRRIIALARPTWVIGENVAGIITLALDDVLADLESDGYAARPFVIPACAVDARHRRDRVWIIARAISRDGDGDGESACTIDDEAPQLPGSAADSDSQRGWQESFCELRSGDQAIAGNDGAPEPLADTAGCGWRERHQECRGSGERTRTQDERSGSSERGWWRPEPNVGRVAHGVPRRVDRLRSLGNAVVPQVVEEIGRAIMRAA